MRHNLREKDYDDICALAERCGVEDVILFGSRARGDHWERSDIDLAVRGGDTLTFALEVDDAVGTLLFIDVVDLGKRVQPELLESIQREGVVLRGKLSPSPE